MLLPVLLSPARALVLTLALLGAGPALAQTVPAANPTNNGPSRRSVPRKTSAAPSVAQPVSPLASAPQVVLPARAEAGPTGWLTDLGAAQAQAKATNRPVVAVFSG